ncbi:MAG: hypothetical protein JNL43_08020 [Flavobacteriales bacterium]|nr:hypothetical protein [Flavobacteriales bacterium]
MLALLVKGHSYKMVAVDLGLSFTRWIVTSVGSTRSYTYAVPRKR